MGQLYQLDNGNITLNGNHLSRHKMVSCDEILVEAINLNINIQMENLNEQKTWLKQPERVKIELTSEVPQSMPMWDWESTIGNDPSTMSLTYWNLNDGTKVTSGLLQLFNYNAGVCPLLANWNLITRARKMLHCHALFKI